jgi:hypothetical protein
MGNFTEDLAFGQTVEQEVLARLKPKIPSGYYYAPDCRPEKSHDLKFVNPFISKTILIEVKCDRESEKTRNVAIEFQCSDQWSGIATTKAQIWVVKFCVHTPNDKNGWDHTIWGMRAVLTRDLVTAWRSKRYRTTYGGDNDRARMFLIPVHEFQTWGVTI